MTTRRQFLASMAAAATLSGVAGAPQFAFGQTTRGKTFIKVFMRGGADGLHLFPLYGDRFYRDYRPELAIGPPNPLDGNTAVSLGGNMRGMNPNLAMLKEIWDTGNMMLAPATTYTNPSHSHFDSQLYIGIGSNVATGDGYLNRYLQTQRGINHVLRGAVLGKNDMSIEAQGKLVIPNIERASNFNLDKGDFCSGTGCADNELTNAMREIASHDVIVPQVEALVRDTQGTMLDAIDVVKRTITTTAPVGGLLYGDNTLGRGLRLCAQLIKGGVPLEVAALDWNIGWDTHSDQISSNTDRFTDQGKNYHRAMRQGANDLLCFFRDMGPAMKDIVVLVGSEFGRTKKQNGSQGTDHGEAGAWFAFGGPTKGGIARDITTIDDTVYRNNWVPMVTNYRDIVGEIMVRHLGMPQSMVPTILPGHTFKDERLFVGNIA